MADIIARGLANKASAQLADIATFATPEMYTGATDQDKINSALNSTYNRVVLKGTYNITNTITVPAGKILECSGATIAIKANVNGIVLNSESKLIGGVINIDSSIQSTYSSNAVTLTSNAKYQHIRDTKIVNAAYTGTGIKFDVNGTGKYITFAELMNFKVVGFNLGIDVTVPNISPHAVGGGYDNWITTCKIHGYVESANQALRLDDESNNGSSVQGMDVMLRGQAGNTNPNYNETVFAKCSQSTFNVILDDAGTSGLVSNFFVFDKVSTGNIYLGVDVAVIDNNGTNIIINTNNDSLKVRKDNMFNYVSGTAYPLGVINNILFHADQRFTVTTSTANGTLYNPNNPFKFGTQNNAEFWRTTSGQDATATYTINLGSATIVRHLAIGLLNSNIGDQIMVRALVGSTWYATAWQTSKEINRFDMFSDVGVTDYLHISQIEINLKLLGTNSTGTFISIASIHAFGGNANSDKGSFLSRSGGTMYGDITLKSGGIARPISSIGSNYTLSANNSTLLGNAATSAITLTLPDATTLLGREFVIKKIDSSANTVTIATTNNQTIDGVTTQVLSTQWSKIKVQSDGTNWQTV